MVQMALYRLYRSCSVIPEVVIGHSLGEYAALYACGVLTATDTILLVGRRAKMMDQHCTPGTHAMLAVKAHFKTIEDLVCRTKTEIACINCPNDVVLSGPVDKMMSAASLLSNSGVQSTRLDMPYACHSSQLNPIIQRFEKFAKAFSSTQQRFLSFRRFLGRTSVKVKL
jgi:acyl transferase domain-containing protein